MNRRKAPAKPNPQTTADLYDPTADEITAHVLGYLRSQGFVAWAQDNRGRYNPKTGKWYPHPNNRVGVPDVIGYRKSDARFIGVEVKAGRDRPSEHQTEFLNELHGYGGFSFIAYSFERFRASFERRGLYLATVATPAAPAGAVPAPCARCPRLNDTAGPGAAAPPAAPTVPPGLPTTHDEPAPYHAQNTRHC